MTVPYLYVFFATRDGRQLPPCPECGAQVESPEVEVTEAPPRVDGPFTYYSTAEVTRRYLLPCGCDVAGVMWLSQAPVLVPA